MRKISETEYQTAKAALAIYSKHCKPFVQKNGWTCIPAGVAPPVYNGEALNSDAVNAHSTRVELFELERDMPEKFSAYVVGDWLQTWTGEKIGRVVHQGRWQTNNFGAKWRAMTFKADWGFSYHGREYDSRQLINLRKVRS